MSEVLDYFNKVSLPQKLLLLILLALGVFVGYFFIFKAEVDSAIAQKRRTEAELTQRRAELAAGVDDIDRVREEITDLCSRQDAFLDKLPPAAEIPSLLSAINQQGQLSGLDISRFVREEAMPGPNYTTVRVRVELKGTYDEVADFFYFIGRQQRIVNVGDIELKVVEWVNPWRTTETSGRGIEAFALDRDEIGPPELEVGCTLRTYYTNAADFGGGEICAAN